MTVVQIAMVVYFKQHHKYLHRKHKENRVRQSALDSNPNYDSHTEDQLYDAIIDDRHVITVRSGLHTTKQQQKGHS